MNIVLAPDSFKECLTAFAVAEALSAGLQRAGIPEEDIMCRPLADGGDGLLDVLHYALGGEIRTVEVSGPLGEPVAARFGLLDDGHTAVVEMAQAAGLHLAPPEKRDPCVAGTRGVGELMVHALDCGAKRILVGLGGSATNDGGVGMATALGVRFLDETGADLPPGGASLRRLARIACADLDARLADTTIIAACDVSNPLCGENGASQVYGPQKGATPDVVKTLDAALSHYATVLETQMCVQVRTVPGAGAAGGLAAGLVAFANASLCSGVDLVLDAYGDMDDVMRDAALVITGEGAVDGQSAQGKVIAGVAKKARIHTTPLLVVAGRVGDGLDTLYKAGVTAILPIAPGPMPQHVALDRAAQHLEQTGCAIGRLLRALRPDQ